MSSMTPDPPAGGPAPVVLPVAPVLASVLGGAVSVVLGVIVLVWPGATLKVGAILFGLQLVVLGVARVGVGAFVRGLESWVRPVYVVSGLLVAVAGIICLRHPVLSVAVIVVTIAIGWLVDGVALVVAGANAESGRLPLLAAGALSVLAAVVLLVLPVTSTGLLLSLGGWLLVITGLVAMIGIPWVMREQRRDAPGLA